MMARPYTPVTVQKQNMHVLEEPPFVLLWAKYRWRQSGTLDLPRRRYSGHTCGTDMGSEANRCSDGLHEKHFPPSAGRALGKGEVNTQSGEPTSDSRTNTTASLILRRIPN